MTFKKTLLSLTELSIFSISICTASFVENINIIGNKHTQDHIILREIYHPTSDDFDSTLALEDRNRIYNLGLFSTVEINPIDSSYTVFVVETFRILPLPLLEYEEGKGFSFGAGIAYLNFRGLNEKLYFGGTIGNVSTYFFNFYDPWKFGNHGSLQGKIYQFFTHSLIYNYEKQIKHKILLSTLFYNNQTNRDEKNVSQK